MGITHPYTAASGELITSARWNADHDIDGPSTTTVMTFLTPYDSTSGYATTCTGDPTWDDVARARINIPGDLFLAFNYVDTSVHWKSSASENIDMRIRNSGNTYNIGQAYINATAGNYHTTLDEDLSIGSWPSGNEEFLIQVKSATASTVITLYNVTCFFRKT